MSLSKDAIRILDHLATLRPVPPDQLPVEEVRELAKEIAKLNGEPQPVARWEDRSVPGPGGDIPIRVYWPRELMAEERIPITVYFHGGGWVVCDVTTHDTYCRRLTNAAQCIVVYVEYRRAPEHRFPAAVEDGYAVLRWLKENAPHLGGDRRKIAVAGDSAGGNLSTVMCLKSRDLNGPPICAQALIYPVTDHWDAGFLSYSENAENYGLTRDFMKWFWGHYLGPEGDRRHPYAAPLRAPFVANLPPALVITAQYDPLRDEGLAYADRLEEAGVIVQRKHYEGQIHGFFGYAAMTADANDAMQTVATFLKRVWRAL
jgi:acetyl esterase